MTTVQTELPGKSIASLLELGGWPVGRPRREAVGGVDQHRLVTQHLEHLLRVRFPVGGQVQRGPDGQP